MRDLDAHLLRIITWIQIIMPEVLPDHINFALCSWGEPAQHRLGTPHTGGARAPGRAGGACAGARAAHAAGRDHGCLDLRRLARVLQGWLRDGRPRAKALAVPPQQVRPRPWPPALATHCQGASRLLSFCHCAVAAVQDSVMACGHDRPDVRLCNTIRAQMQEGSDHPV